MYNILCININNNIIIESTKTKKTNFKRSTTWSVKYLHIYLYDAEFSVITKYINPPMKITMA